MPLGNTRVVVDVDKNVVERYDYYPFGLVSRSSVSSDIETIQKFTGKELDDEHGVELYYFGARYHDPVTGRFVSVDPLAVKYPNWLPYTYTLNNPLIFVDPDGRQSSNTPMRQMVLWRANNTFEQIKDHANKTIESTKEPIQEVSKNVAEVADNTSTGLVAACVVVAVFQPELIPALPQVLAYATGAEVVAVSSKVVNKTAGGDDFSTTDLVGDAAGLLIPANLGADDISKLMNAAGGVIVDQAVDNMEQPMEKADEEKDNKQRGGAGGGY